MKFLIIFKFGKEIKLERQNFQNPNRPQKCGNPDSAKSRQTAATAQKQTTTDAAEIEDDL